MVLETRVNLAAMRKGVSPLGFAEAGLNRGFEAAWIAEVRLRACFQSPFGLLSTRPQPHGRGPGSMGAGRPLGGSAGMTGLFGCGK